MMLGKYFHYYRPYRKILCGVILGASLTAALDLLFPVLVRHVLSVELPQKNVAGIFSFVAVLLVLYCINFAVLYLVNYYGHVMSASIENDMRRDLFAHLQEMPFEFYDASRTGQILSRLTSDIVEVSELTFRGPNDLFVCSITMFGSIIILFWMNVYLGGLIAFLLCLKTLHTVIVNRKMKNAFRENRTRSGEVSAQAGEAISGIRLVKAFAREEDEQKRFMEKSNEFFAARKHAYRIMSYFSGSVNFFTNFTNLAILGTGGMMIARGLLQFSDFVAFLLYVNLFMRPLLRLTIFTEMYQRGMAGFRRFYEIMQEEPGISDAPDAVEAENIKGRITFDHVTFGYGEEGDVLHDISLEINPGERVAFVGATGAGKTTITSLLLRFYETGRGRILLDGTDIARYSQRSLRRQIGLVQQDVFLFSDSVKYNIGYGRLSATDEEIVNAARLAAADDFIRKLPQGYDTRIGERGVKLSGGQKQRISIARVFLKNPPVLVLDEATSSLDGKTERQIQKSLDDLARGRTTVTVAHRLSTIINSDRIIVLHNGRIVESGTHEELMAAGGLYRTLYELDEKEE